jgi:hypothetical protein
VQRTNHSGLDFRAAQGGAVTVVNEMGQTATRKTSSPVFEFLFAA